jgi:hypothetical protein
VHRLRETRCEAALATLQPYLIAGLSVVSKID